ncbi:unnamed protein product [Ascophyllum nodosum]
MEKGRTSDRCLDAVNVALSATCDGNQWFASTKELQLASLDFCIACRGANTLRLRVDGDTPPTLLAVTQLPSGPKGKRSTRLPRFRAHDVTWKLPSAAELRVEIHALIYTRSWVFGAEFDKSLDAVVWPHHLERLALGYRYNRKIDRVSWPSSLQELEMGHHFNQPIDGVSWPRSLKVLTFGFDFNQPIEGVTWTDSIREITFGCSFNQDVGGVVWPTSLVKLTFGRCFNRPIDAVVWPASLRHLTLGYSFNQAIDGVSWPASLRQLILGYDFNQPIADAAWSSSLEQLTFGSCFDQTIESVSWPRSLKHLTFGFRFDQSVAYAAWPALRRLTLGWRFKQSLLGIGTWFPNLEDLTLMMSRADYPHSLVGVDWPAALTRLTLGVGFDLDVATLPRGVKVVFKKFYGKRGFVFSTEPLSAHSS